MVHTIEVPQSVTGSDPVESLLELLPRSFSFVWDETDLCLGRLIASNPFCQITMKSTHSGHEASVVPDANDLAEAEATNVRDYIESFLALKVEIEDEATN